MLAKALKNGAALTGDCYEAFYTACKADAEVSPLMRSSLAGDQRSLPHTGLAIPVPSRYVKMRALCSLD